MRTLKHHTNSPLFANTFNSVLLVWFEFRSSFPRNFHCTCFGQHQYYWQIVFGHNFNCRCDCARSIGDFAAQRYTQTLLIPVTLATLIVPRKEVTNRKGHLTWHSLAL